MIATVLIGTLTAGAGLAQEGTAGDAKPAAAAAPKKSWTDYLSFKGDVRLRYEMSNDDSKTDSSGEHYTRDRARIRARLSSEAKIEDMKIGLGLRTGGSSPTSGNVTLGDGFTSKDFALCLAYIEYRFFADQPYGLSLVGGKFKNPLMKLPDDLLWDGDLNPEGLAAKAVYENDLITAYLNAEGMWIEERKTEDNAYGVAGQAALKFNLMSNVGLTLGGTVCAYQGIKGYEVIGGSSYGNSTTTESDDTKAWSEDFTPMVGFAKCDLSVGIPVSLSVQGITNPGADDDNTGYSAGISLGKAKKPNSLQVGYSYTRLEKDATLGMFTDSDRWGGGTDGKGSKFYGKYQITKNLQAAATYLLGQKGISGSDGGSDYDCLQLDIAAKF